MTNQTIVDIYDANDRIHRQLLEALADLSDEQANFLPGSEKWTIAQIVEHIAVVKDGMTEVSGKLLEKAQSTGKQTNGTLSLSDDFKQKAAKIKNLKLEAPDHIQPTGKQTVAESLRKIDETRANLEVLRPLFETVECADARFPHPFMGDLTAHEWLVLIGGHESRHLEQIKNRLEK